MADIFGRKELTYGGSFAADSAIVSFVGEGTCNGIPAGLAAGAGMLAQQMGFQYQQPIQRFFELGSQSVYYFAGRPQGQGSMARLLGPRLVAELFYLVLGNVCCADGNNITVSAQTGCANGNAGDQGFITWTLKGVLLSSIGSQIAAEDMIWREQLTFMFYCLTSNTLNEAAAVIQDLNAAAAGGADFTLDQGGVDFGAAAAAAAAVPVLNVAP